MVSDTEDQKPPPAIPSKRKKRKTAFRSSSDQANKAKMPEASELDNGEAGELTLAAAKVRFSDIVASHDLANFFHRNFWFSSKPS